MAQQLGQGAAGDHLPAQPPGARPNVDEVIGAAHGVFIVLDHHQRVALADHLVRLGRRDLRHRGVGGLHHFLDTQRHLYLLGS
ncbi:hypothetical protein GALL_531230 [mine drainage metagenome]|uniref:Uncharacterized protein n=1 Tax=mine drainage metagenome TaxID=410659 RepID=A0A1J5PBZ0_9ZZZZ